MGWRRGMGRLLGGVAAGLVLVPALALLPAAILDRGPDGAVRGTAFHIGLVASDPLVWDCVRNSLAAAIAVAFGSLVMGVGLARIVERWQFWGRRPLAALAWTPLAVFPVCGAIGLRGLVGPEWPASDVFGPGRVPWGWLGLIWVELACGVPLVAGGVRRALRQVDPAWEEAARLAGASRRQAWHGVIWPVVRPDAARGVAAVFVLALMEPGAPLVLGLRRSLAFQTVEAAVAPDPTPRVAILALAGLILALVGRVLVLWWGGDPPARRPRAEEVRARRAEWPRATAFNLALGGWAAGALLPALALVVTAWRPCAGWNGQGTVPPHAGDAFQDLFGDPEARRLIFHSLALGLAVGGLNLVVAKGVTAPAARRLLIAVPEAIPPLVLGVGASMVPLLLGAWADARHAGGTPSPLVEGLRGLADGLDPYRAPGILLGFAVATTLLPVLVRGVESGPGGSRRWQIEAARTLGASRRRARRTAAGPLLGSSVGAAWILTMALAATNVAPALVLSPTTAARPLGPALVTLADQPGGGLRRAAALACGALAVNLTAFALFARSPTRPVPPDRGSSPPVS